MQISRHSENQLLDRHRTSPERGRQFRLPLSKDPDRRKKQLANLRPAGAAKHGATSERRLEPLRAKHRGELLEHFPQIDPFRLSLLCDLLARCDLAREFLDVHGLMRNTRQAHPVLDLLTRWERRAWDMLSQLAPQDSTARAWDRDTPELQIELSAEEQIGLMAADENTRTDVVHRILKRLSEERRRGGATSLRRTSLNARADGRPPEKLSVHDLTEHDVTKLEELNAQAEAKLHSSGPWSSPGFVDT